MSTFRTSALAIVVLAVASCDSTNRTSMSPEDMQVWTAAREHHGVGALDDRSFLVYIQEKGKQGDGDADTLEFAGGRFHSTACDEYGFGTSTYTTRAVTGGTEFHALCKNAKGATNEWHGTVRGDTIDGGFTYTEPGNEPEVNTFSGKAK